MQAEKASSLAEVDGGREICTGTPRYTLPVASSGRISLCKCRDMRGRPLVYAFSGIIGAHISYGITSGCQCGEAMWCTRSFTPPPAPFRMTESQLRSGRQRTGCSYGDKGGDSSMMTRNVIPCGSEESDHYLYPSPPAAYGPRTRYFRISLNINVLQKSVVRGPLKKVGTANKVVLYCVVFQWITKS